MSDIWPEFPIVLLCHHQLEGRDSQLPGVLNVYAVLERPDRICELEIDLRGGFPQEMWKTVAAIKRPFLALTSLRLSSDLPWPWQPTIEDSFLGGITPRLRLVELNGVPFPAPQKLLLSATDLVTLRMEHIPYTGYIPPEEVVTCLSSLTKLEVLSLGFLHYHRTLFDSPQTHQRPRVPSPSTVLPALTSFQFQGDCWYLDVLITRISFPLLNDLDVMFFDASWENVNFPSLCEFVNRIKTLDVCHRVDISFHPDFVNTTLSRQEGLADCRKIKFGILHPNLDHPDLELPILDWQLLYLIQLRSFSLPPLPALEHLYIHDHGSFPAFCGPSTEESRWLELLRPFTSVKKLYLSERPALRVACALEGLSGERVTEVLPALQDISILGHEPSVAILKAFGKFVATPQASGCSVSIHYQQGGGRVVFSTRRSTFDWSMRSDLAGVPWTFRVMFSHALLIFFTFLFGVRFIKCLR
jgi:hypothetical protein